MHADLDLLCTLRTHPGSARHIAAIRGAAILTFDARPSRRRRAYRTRGPLHCD